MSRKAFLVTALLVSLLLAGVASYYASAHPDGLEYVAAKTGFLNTADEPADGPFADYQVPGIGSDRLSGGAAGVVGVLAVLLLAGGLGYAVRRRPSPDDREA